MQRTRVAPNRTGLLGPVHAGDAVVIPRDESHDVVADHLVLVAVDVVDARHVEAHAREQRFPAGDGMRAHDRVVRCEVIPGV